MDKEYIERGVLLEDISESVVHTVRDGYPSPEARGANKVIDRIKAAPAADVVEVKHGEWLSNAVSDEYVCSECDGIAPVDCEKEDFYESNYCPNCGAKMDGQAGDNDV